MSLDEKVLGKIVDQWANCAAEIKSHHAELTSLHRTLDGMNTKIYNFKVEMSNFNAELSDLKSDLTSFKAEHKDQMERQLKYIYAANALLTLTPLGIIIVCRYFRNEILESLRVCIEKLKSA